MLTSDAITPRVVKRPVAAWVEPRYRTCLRFRGLVGATARDGVRRLLAGSAASISGFPLSQ